MLYFFPALLILAALPAFSGDSDRNLGDLAASRVSSGRLEGFLERVSRVPHVAGTPESRALALELAGLLREHGLEVETPEYDVLLSYPRSCGLELLGPSAALKLALPEGELLPDATAYRKEDLMPWNAYGASGEATAPVVYANFGRPQDFEDLARIGVDIKGRIVLARYGEGYRGGKTLEAEKRGAAAILFYSDPAQDGYVQGDPLPKGPWGPPDHFQRGSNVYDFIVPGDPLTPGWASTPGAKRIPQEESKVLPRIPSLPLSYRDASLILEALGGPAVPKGWQGGLPFTYHVGPGPAEARLKVENTREIRRIVNVIGRLRGGIEPDREVFLSAHHDAWTRGAMDDGIGLAVMLELSRAFGGLAREGVRPRRTLVFSLWDAEEYTLTGSTEWGEEHAPSLREGAVAVLNVDAYRWGSEFTAIAVPSLRKVLRDSLQGVTDPGTGRPLEAPRIGIMGSGSDYTVFLNHLGVPAVETMFTGTAGAYHSIYDDPSWVASRVDPGLRYVAAMASLVARLASRLAEDPVLPFEYSEYAREVRGYLQELAQDPALPPAAVEGSLRALKGWEEAAVRTETASGGDAPADRPRRGASGTAAGRRPEIPAGARCASEALMAVERALLDEKGLPGRPWFKHLIYAPLPSYEAETLPGIREALREGDLPRAKAQLAALETALERASKAQSKAANCLLPATEPRGLRPAGGRKSPLAPADGR